MPGFVLRLVLPVLILVFAAEVLADEITLKNGDRVSGKIVSQTGEAIVVETGVCEPAANSLSKVSLGAGRATGWTIRRGSGPPSERRRSRRYWTSSESGPGW